MYAPFRPRFGGRQSLRTAPVLSEIERKRTPDDLRHVYIVIYRALPHSSPHIGLDLE